MHGILDDHCNPLSPLSPYHVPFQGRSEQVPSFEQDLTLQRTFQTGQKGFIIEKPQGGFCRNPLSQPSPILPLPEEAFYSYREASPIPLRVEILDSQVAHPNTMRPFIWITLPVESDPQSSANRENPNIVLIRTIAGQ